MPLSTIYSLWFQFSRFEYTAAIEILEEIKQNNKRILEPMDFSVRNSSRIVIACGFVKFSKIVPFCANYLYYFKHILTFAELASKMLHRNALWQMATCT